MNQPEQWKIIPQTAGNLREYKVSNYGDVVRIYNGKEELINPEVVKYYPRIRIRINGKDHVFYIHKLVADLFIKNLDPTTCKYVRHKDGNKFNNRIDNLFWITEEERGKGFEPATAKLTASKVKIIRKWAKSTSFKIIAKHFGISIRQVGRIVSGEQWKVVPE